ncbi:MAG: hypothetical protein ABSC56_00370 [Solirubrobacteraceae bacterium]|jgi:DnaK suppressor protein
MNDEHARELLEQARREAEDRLNRLRTGGVEDEGEQEDASSDSDELVGYETDAALEELLTRRLEAIARAQARLEAGTYGSSVRSGAPIPDGRLEIEPWAELTVEEQAST